MSEDARALARRTALDLLARREHSFHELLEKLCERHRELDRDAIIRPVLEELAAAKLQSDERFVQAYVRYKSLRGDGPLKIAAGLQPRKINSSLLKRALYEEGPDWIALCSEALRRKSKGGTTTASERAKLQRFLQQRGFTVEQVRAVFKGKNDSIEE